MDGRTAQSGFALNELGTSRALMEWKPHPKFKACHNVECQELTLHAGQICSELRTEFWCLGWMDVHNFVTMATGFGCKLKVLDL